MENNILILLISFSYLIYLHFAPIKEDDIIKFQIIATATFII